MSAFKLAFFTAASFGIYAIWWFWSQWRAESPNDSRESAAFKSFFWPIFFYSIARRVEEEAEKHGTACRYSPAALTGIMWATVVANGVLEKRHHVLVGVLFLPVPLIPLQQTINRVNQATTGDSPQPWRWWQVLIAVALGLLWLQLLIGLLLTVPTE